MGDADHLSDLSLLRAEDLDDALAAVDANAVAVLDALGGVLRADHGRDAELAAAAQPDGR